MQFHALPQHRHVCSKAALLEAMVADVVVPDVTRSATATAEGCHVRRAASPHWRDRPPSSLRGQASACPSSGQPSRSGRSVAHRAGDAARTSCRHTRGRHPAPRMPRPPGCGPRRWRARDPDALVGCWGGHPQHMAGELGVLVQAGSAGGLAAGTDGHSRQPAPGRTGGCSTARRCWARRSGRRLRARAATGKFRCSRGPRHRRDGTVGEHMFGVAGAGRIAVPTRWQDLAANAGWGPQSPQRRPRHPGEPNRDARSQPPQGMQVCIQRLVQRILAPVTRLPVARVGRPAR